MNLLKKENLWQFFFFSDINVELNSKNLWKMIFADAKVKKNKNERSGGCTILKIFIRSIYLQNLLQYNEKRQVEPLILVGILSIMTLSVLGWGFVCSCHFIIKLYHHTRVPQLQIRHLTWKSFSIYLVFVSSANDGLFHFLFIHGYGQPNF